MFVPSAMHKQASMLELFYSQSGWMLVCCAPQHAAWRQLIAWLIAVQLAAWRQSAAWLIAALQQMACNEES